MKLSILNANATKVIAVVIFFSVCKFRYTSSPVFLSFFLCSESLEPKYENPALRAHINISVIDVSNFWNAWIIIMRDPFFSPFKWTASNSSMNIEQFNETVQLWLYFEIITISQFFGRPNTSVIDVSSMNEMAQNVARINNWIQKGVCCLT